MEDINGREYTDDILISLNNSTSPQIILDCAAIYSNYYTWIAQYAALPTTVNPPPIFYQKPGWQFYLEGLTLNYFASSLPEATAGDVKANSTQNDKLISAKGLARDFKKFQLLILQRKLITDSWKVIGMEFLHNYGGMFNYANLKSPLLTQGEVDMFGTTTQIAVQFRERNISRKIEVPTTDDILTIRGNFRLIVTL
jgi:hypothetical protein